CRLQIKSAPFLRDFHFKSALLIFGFFMNHILKVAVGFVGMWESRRLFQVIVESVGKSQDFSILSTMTAFPQSLSYGIYGLKL
ncbi:MAG: hypothetical protein ACPLZD_10910, partial [Candidatus Saccharicenans sp.]